MIIYVRKRIMPPFNILIVLLVSIIFLNLTEVKSQEKPDSTGYESLSPDAFNTVLAFFKYDRTIPLDVRVLERYETRNYVRDKFVLTGVRGDRIPGYIAVPKSGRGPFPIVLLFHVGAGSKESWWDPMSFERGLAYTDSLISCGIALLAIDAQYHGERSMNNDFLSIQQMYFDNKWYYRYRDAIMQTIGDYSRAVDYLEERRDIDLQRIGVLGHSIGGAEACLFAAFDKRVKALVASGAAYDESWLYPIKPINIARGINAAALILGGRIDNIINIENTKKLYLSLGSQVKEIEIYESGHRLPVESVRRSVIWLDKYLHLR